MISRNQHLIHAAALNGAINRGISTVVPTGYAIEAPTMSAEDCPVYNPLLPKKGKIKKGLPEDKLRREQNKQQRKAAFKKL